MTISASTIANDTAGYVANGDGTATASAGNCDTYSASIGDLPGHGNNLESDATNECGFTAASDLHAEPQLGSLALGGGSEPLLLRR